MAGPILWGPNNISNSLQNAIRMANGKLITDGGPYNLIPYAEFETGLTTGWGLGTATLTNAFPSGVPSFGSGASGNLTLGVNSSTPILGTYSLSLASSAATTAGNFVASDQFSIPFQMQGKVIAFKFSYNAAANGTNGNFSGTSSNSFGVAFWDATNSTWIQPAGVFNLVQGSGVGISTGTVQPPTTCLAGRLVIYNANATSGAITMIYDDFYLGLQTTSIGPAMQDWQALTVTLSAGFGTVTNQSIWYRRDGDTMSVRGTFKLGTAAANGTFIQLGNTIDTAKFSSTANVQVVGKCWRYPSSSTNFAGAGAGPYPMYYDGSSNNLVWISGNTASNAITAQNVSSTFSTGEAIGFEFSVPIAGWSSNTVQSADTATKVIEAQYTSTTTSNVTVSAQFMDFATLITDNSAAVVGAGNGLNSTYTNTWRFVAPSAGFYLIKYQIAATSASSAQGLLLNSAVNLDGVAVTGGTYTGVQQGTGAYLVNATCPGHILWCASGQAISVTVATNTTPTNWPLVAGGRTSISINLLSGPAVVQASDSVNARYFASSTSISGSDATIVWTTKDYDSNNAMSSGSYTIPVSGKYSIKSQVQVTATYALNQNTQIGIFKNGVQVTGAIAYAGGANTSLAPLVADDVPCLAGDVITIKVNSSGSGPALAASNVRNYVAIARVGN